MKIGIIGVGIVGNAIYKSLIKKIGNDNVVSYDKYKNIGNLLDTLNTEIIFLCLPTPYDDKLKSYDLSPITDVCKYLNDNKYDGLVVIKSTVEPTTTATLNKKYTNLSMCHNPEFLTARTAEEDFENQNHIILGKTEQCSLEKYTELCDFYKKHYPHADISLCTSSESELAKLGVNNFYSVKIQFFNELYQLANKHTDIQYETLKNLMLKNGWINPMHTQVPGSDGKLSYGGMCFPKDTNALLQYMIKMDTIHEVLGATINENKKLRPELYQ